MVSSVSAISLKEMDRLVNNQAAENSFKKFVKCGGVPSAKTSISTLFMLHAIITDAVDA